MREVVVDREGGTVTVSAGTLVGEAVDDLYKNKVHTALGTCNTVGVIGAMLGGGLGRAQGLIGLGIDNMISARLVMADGKIISVSATENSDLWWGLRGAGHGFGIVTKLVIRTHPELNGGQQWLSNLIFTPDKINSISEAVNGLDCVGI